ncbi:MAG TPA: OB-fold domain-containing protein [Acidimicrobiales bacterium]|jgi:hypothetical protein
MTQFAYAPPPLVDDPHADEYTAPFWQATLREELTAPRCAACGTFRLPPHRFCHRCRAQALEWLPLPGTGTLYSFIVVRHPLRPDMADHIPYVPAVIEADGAPGCRFVSNVVDCEPGLVAIGMPVRVVWDHVNERTVIPRWRPA